jgi:putative restriction endonuclease
VAVAEERWFRHLADLAPDEVCFWRHGDVAFRALTPGEPFLFKLPYPLHRVAGGAFFVAAVQIPPLLAWKAFGERTGSPDHGDFRRRCQGAGPPAGRGLLTCLILNQPFFLPRRAMLAPPGDWSPATPFGRVYRTDRPEGRDLWERVRPLLPTPRPGHQLDLIPGEDEISRRGEGYLFQGHLGEGAFRVLVTMAYRGRCAVTGAEDLAVLEAVHIRPVSRGGPNAVSNGILLRADLAALFRLGYLGFGGERRLEVSPRLGAEPGGEGTWAAFRGAAPAVTPPDPGERPAEEHLRWHRRHVFLEG